jgi:eukaryotic-like serine/threonine-protein kinase
VPDILAIVSRAIFEKDARVGGKPLTLGGVWPVDRYNSTNKALERLEDGGRIFLVTVRPPNEELWFVGVVDSPVSDGTAWVSAKKNTLPATNISALRKTIVFESGKGMSLDKGTLGMSLQSPRGLTAPDVAQILACVSGKAPVVPPPVHVQTAISPNQRPPARVIGGKYEVLGQLGQGGMGAVYEARHTGTGRRVAVKEIVGDELKKDPQIIERLQREARATGAIESQHIALMLDSGVDDKGNPFLVMELLHGEDLQQLIVRKGPLPQDVALCVAAQACIGLRRAHEEGVVHRDIKPANLFLARREATRLGRRDADEVLVKLLDFGIARVREGMSATENRALTSTGLMLGTPLYMSPEQVTNPKTVDHRTDVWSLGVVLYEMLTGSTPHSDVETLGGLLVAICSKPARPLSEVAPHVRRPIAAIVKKALEIDPATRYESADAFLGALTKELTFGTTLTDEALGLKPASVRADPDARSAFELAATSPAAPDADSPNQRGVPDGTMRSATPVPGVFVRPGGERKG